MKTILVNTKLNEEQVDKRLDLFLGSDQEFENLVLIKNAEGYRLTEKKWDDPIVQYKRKKIFDFLNIQIAIEHLNDHANLVIKLKTVRLSISTILIFGILIWSGYLLVENYARPIFSNTYLFVAAMLTFWVLKKSIKAYKYQKRIVAKMELFFSKN